MRTLLLSLILTITIPLYTQPRIILDTDFGGDADDLGALVMLNHFIDNKECELLAVISWSLEKYTVSAIDAVNRYYNHPDIPIGTRKGDTYYADWNYNKAIVDRLPYEKTYENTPDATVLYRQLLSRSDDKSIVIVTIGPLMNIKNLIESQPDSISPLSGKELIQNKVVKFVMMGGQYPVGQKEWNFDGNMPGVTRFVIQNLDVPVVFSGYEVGLIIKTGEIFNSIDKETPLYIGFMHFSQHAPWMKDFFKGKILANSTYDQTAVLYAVRGGEGIYWDKVYGTCIPDENGGNTWVNSDKGKHAYLKLKVAPSVMAELIDSLMLGKTYIK